jgi:hypothetical protein
VKSAFLSPNAPIVGDEVQVDVLTQEALTVAMQKDFNDDVRAQAAAGHHYITYTRNVVVPALLSQLPELAEPQPVLAT